MDQRMPSVFIAHGTPLNVLDDNTWTRTWQRLGSSLPVPRAILSISAHWCTHGVNVTAMDWPPTIHDFRGFPDAMFKISYPAPGDPKLALHVGELLAPLPVTQDRSWGFDHGTWSVLSKAFPRADIPVIQLSIDVDRFPADHFEIGRRLMPLRDQGVLILGSGNVVHNLMMHRRGDTFAYDWALRFNDYIRESLTSHRFDQIINYAASGVDASLSVPTPDHFYPLLYAAGAAGDDAATIVVDGVYSGAISMLSAMFGAPKYNLTNGLPR